MHPIVLGVLGAITLGGGFWAYTHKQGQPASPPPATPPPTPQGNPITPVTVNPVLQGQQAAAADLGPLPAGYSSYADWVQKASPAVPAAHALYDYLKAHGVDNSDTMHNLTKAFQTAHDSNQVSVGIGGQLPQTGIYDALTSAALTTYTGDPIAGDLQAPLPGTATLGQVLTNKVIGQGGTNTGSAFSSGFNVKQWLEKNGTTNLADPNLHQLVAQFQNDMNNDPLFPGPAYAPSPKPPIMYDHVDVTGDLGDQGSTTRKALKAQTDPDSESTLYNWL